MELMVALVIVSLLGTLVVQGLAFFAGSYDAVKRSQRDATHAALRQHWFVTAVRGIVPYGLETRAFSGDATGFDAITLQALDAEPGMTTAIRWAISDGGPTRTVRYTANEREWTVVETAAPDLAFEYADATGRWHSRWPLEDQPTHWTPTVIRLVSSGEGTVWLARVEASPEPAIVDVLLR